MKTYILHRRIRIERPLKEVFDFFSRAENLERITPPWLRFQMLSEPEPVRQGARIAYKLRVHGLPISWLTEIEDWDPPYEFVDVQLRGPYRLWRHTHRFAAEGDCTWTEDTVEYALPFGPLGRIAHRLAVARDVAQIFDYREKRIQAIFPPNRAACDAAYW